MLFVDVAFVGGPMVGRIEDVVDAYKHCVFVEGSSDSVARFYECVLKVCCVDDGVVCVGNRSFVKIAAYDDFAVGIALNIFCNALGLLGSGN